MQVKKLVNDVEMSFEVSDDEIIKHLSSLSINSRIIFLNKLMKVDLNNTVFVKSIKKIM
jgi:hypothetical protein